jgi:lipoate-protein ligase A
MRFLTNPSTDPWYNMSFDEYCLEQYPSNDCFFYLWRNRPSVIVGANQNVYTEVNLAYLDAHDIRLARRVTGGGAVYHDLQNLNYTIIGRGASPEPVVAALRALGVPAELTGRNDIFVEGRKVSGYARRLWRDREIIHGTLMYDVDLDTLARALDVPGSKLAAKGIASVRSRVANLKDYLPQFPSLDAFQAALQDILAAGDGELPFGESRCAVVQRLSDEKFSTWEWRYGASRAADLVRSGRLACGSVEAHLSLDRGVLTAVEFRGDFLGALPAAGLAERLVGLRFERETIEAALQAAPISSYFDGTSADDLLYLLLSGAAGVPGSGL